MKDGLDPDSTLGEDKHHKRLHFTFSLFFGSFCLSFLVFLIFMWVCHLKWEFVDLVVIFMMIFGMVLVLVFVLLVLFCFERHILKNRLEEKKKNSCIKWIVCFESVRFIHSFFYCRYNHKRKRKSWNFWVRCLKNLKHHRKILGEIVRTRITNL